MRLKTIIFLAVFSLTLTTSYAHAGLKISCSMFPVYDFTRAVTGSSADIRIILKPGTEPHDFEPSPMDIKALNDSDVFVFTGRHMEHWADRIAGTITNTLIVDASNGIHLTAENDPHIWMDLSLAQRMIYNITEALCSADPGNSAKYTHNAAEYCAQLAELDEKFAALPKNRTLVFAGEFSCVYFVRRYGFEYVSAYEGENEPGIKRMAEIIRHIQENHVRHILSDLPISLVTQSISKQTRTEILPFFTAHTAQDTSRTFLQIMADNFTNLARFLND